MSVQRQYHPGDIPVPGYRLLEHLGQGGLGDVWKAEAAGGAQVALKIVSGLGNTSALKELHALEMVKNIRHPNLVAIHGIWLKDEQGELLDDNWFATETGSGRVKIKVQPPNESSTTIFGEPGSSSDHDAPEAHDRDLAETRPASLAPDDNSPQAAAAQSSTQPSDRDAHQAAEPSYEAELLLAMGLGSENLFDRLLRCKQQGLDGLPSAELLDYLADAAKAIDLMNREHGIQHCDIKPKNLLVAGGAVQVCDFGLAQALNELRQAKAAAFTVAYAAPEVVSRQQPSVTTDQYCLAISYFELRTGDLPFVAKSVKGVIKEKLRGELKLDALPQEERRVIARATALLPAARFASCGDLVAALRAALEADSRPEPAMPLRNASRTYFNVAVAAAIALLVIAGIYFWSQTSDRRAFTHALEEYADSGSLFDPQLAAAAAALERLPHNGTFERAEVELLDAWATAVGDSNRAQTTDMLLASSLSFLQERSRRGEARQLRLAILQSLADSARVDLAAERTDAAKQTFEEVDAYLDQNPEDAISEIRRTVRLGVARVAARRAPHDTAAQITKLSQLAEFANLAKPDLSEFTPEDRGPALALLALAASEHGYKRVLPLLFQLATDEDLQPHLTSWEQNQMSLLRNQTRRQVEQQAPLTEPWRSMAAAVWLTNADTTGKESSRAAN